MTARPAKSNQGFILPLVLWMIAALALIAAVLGQWATQGVDSASSRRRDFDAELRFEQAKTDILYQIAIQLLSTRGLEIADKERPPASAQEIFAPNREEKNYVALDDRPYRLHGLDIRIQDARGLINLSLSKDEEVFKLLGLFDVPIEARAGLIAKLKDYTSSGDLPRLNGAKTRQYIEAGKPRPRLAPLTTPFEIRRVLDWDQYPELWQMGESITDITAAGDGFGINLNTAAPKVLATIQGLNPRAVELILATRKTRPIQNVQDAQMAAGVSFAEDPMRYISFPADTFRIKLRDPSRKLERVFVIKITAGQTSGPWRIDYELDLPQISSNDRNAEIPPDFPTATPAAVAGR